MTLVVGDCQDTCCRWTPVPGVWIPVAGGLGAREAGQAEQSPVAVPAAVAEPFRVVNLMFTAAPAANASTRPFLQPPLITRVHVTHH